MLKTFLKGLAMGTCDVIPGISGGTIAFITGIYTRLMDGIKQYTPKNAKQLFFGSTSERRKVADLLDFWFFIPLIMGILIAFYVGSYFIPYLLVNYFVFTMSFFIGLIVASGVYIFKHIKQHNFHNHIIGCIGFLVGGSFYYFVPVNVEPNLLFLFFAGMIALSATLLPGISGSYILLILGVYEYIISSIHAISSHAWQLGSFAIGAIIGIMIISRIVSHFLHKHKSPTLYLLVGLVVGSLNTPMQRVLSADFIWSFGNLFFVALLFVLGIVLVLGLEKVSSDGKIA